MLIHLNCQDAQALLKQAQWLDIRAIAAYQQGHIPGALHFDANALTLFSEHTPKSTPLIIYCYYGISSQQVGHYLQQAGFQSVSTLDGGFTEWLAHYPTLISTLTHD